MELLGRTSSTGFSQHRRKTANNNHIKIRTVCYNTTTSTSETDKHNTTATATDDFGDRANMLTQYIWLRKPVGVPTQLNATSSHKTFGLRTNSSMGGGDRALKTMTDGFLRSGSEATFNPVKNIMKNSATTYAMKKVHDPFFLEFVQPEYLGEKHNYRRMQDRADLLFPIPDESKIKERFKMRIPVRVDAMENQFSTIHLLEQPWPGIETIKDHGRCIKRDLAILRRQEEVMRGEMKDFGEKMNIELDEMKAYLVRTMAGFRKDLSDDSVEHQNLQVPMHKGIQKLRNLREELIVDMTKEYERIGRVEDKLFKAQVFDLRTDDKTLEEYDRGILRKEHEPLLVEIPRIKKIRNASEPSKQQTKKKAKRFD